MLAWHNFMKYKRDVLSLFILSKSTLVVILDVIVPIGLMEYVSVNCFVDFSDSGEKVWRLHH